MLRPEPYREDRPWGNFTRFTLNEPVTVKIIEVGPGEMTSLQSHKNREEFWEILEGEFLITMGDLQEKGVARDRFWVSQGTKHRITGVGASNRLLEISYGTFDENDIERFDDQYGRVS
ncbi:MAG: phosphomannose isomerase type II C-terminal cupin domain [Patescibacteria group bacterium]